MYAYLTSHLRSYKKDPVDGEREEEYRKQNGLDGSSLCVLGQS